MSEGDSRYSTARLHDGRATHHMTWSTATARRAAPVSTVRCVAMLMTASTMDTLHAHRNSYSAQLPSTPRHGDKANAYKSDSQS